MLIPGIREISMGWFDRFKLDKLKGERCLTREEWKAERYLLWYIYYHNLEP